MTLVINLVSFSDAKVEVAPNRVAFYDLAEKVEVLVTWVAFDAFGGKLQVVATWQAFAVAVVVKEKVKVKVI